MDDSESHFSDSCQQAKIIKIYNQELQKRFQQPYQFIYTDLAGLINYVGSAGKRQFFTFTNNCTWYIKMYTDSKKSGQPKCFKAFYSSYCTRSKQNHPIERLQSDYGSELQRQKADNQLEKDGSISGPSTPQCQKQNTILERVRRTIIDIIKATILKKNMNNQLWLKTILTITYIKNNYII